VMNFLCFLGRRFLCFLGRRFLQVGNHLKRAMCMLIIQDDFYTKLLCLRKVNFFSGVILSGLHCCRTCLGNMDHQVHSQ
jgi:hypothetical protein